MDASFYARRMRDLREDHDYTQEYVSKWLGIRQSYYACYENRHNALPIHHLLNLCELYHVSADYILGLTDDPTPPPKSKVNR